MLQTHYSDAYWYNWTFGYSQIQPKNLQNHKSFEQKKYNRPAFFKLFFVVCALSTNI